MSVRATMSLEHLLPGGRRLAWTHEIERDDDGRIVEDRIGDGRIDGCPIPDVELEELLRSEHAGEHVAWALA